MEIKMRTRPHAPLVIAAALLAGAALASPANAQDATQSNRANWELAEKFSSDKLSPFVYSSSVQTNWINETDSLWYRWEDAGGVQFKLLIPKAGSNQPLFDHVTMAAKLSEATREAMEAHSLPIEDLEFQEDGFTIHFEADSTLFAFNLQTEELSERPEDEEEDEVAPQGGRGGRGGGGGGNRDWRAFSEDSTAFAFARDHNLYVVEVETGDTIQLSTDGEEEFSFGNFDEDAGRGGGRGGRGGGGGDDDDEEDDFPPANGKVRASVTWSPDSRAFYVQRSDQREVKSLYLVNSLADPRPELLEYNYTMPGESETTQREIFVYKRGDSDMNDVPVEKWKDQAYTGMHWTTGSDVMRMVRRDRLQRNQELIEIDTETMDVNVLIRESVQATTLERQTHRYVEEGGDIIWWSERSGWGHYYLYDHDGNLKNPITTGTWRAESIAEIDSVGGRLFVTGVGREEGENVNYPHLYRVNLDGTGITLLDPGDAAHNSQVSPSMNYVIDNSSRVDRAGVSLLRDANGEVLMELEEQDISKLMEYGLTMPEPFVVKAADGFTDIYGVMWKPSDFDAERSYPIIAHVYPGPQQESVSETFSATRSQQTLAELGFIVVQIGNRGGTPGRSNAYQAHANFNMRDYGLADKKAGIEQLAARHSFIDLDNVGIYGHSGGGFMTGAALLQPPYNQFFKAGVSSSGNHDNNVYNQNWSEQYHGLVMEFTLKSAAAVTDSASGGAGPNGNAGARGANGNDPSQEADQEAASSGDPITDQEVIDELYRRHVEEGDSGIEEEYDISFEIHIPANHELAENLENHLLLVHGDMDNNVHPAGTIRLADALIEANKRFDLFIMPGAAHGYGSRQAYFQRLLQEFFAEHLMGDYYRGSGNVGGGGG